ncbi:hypothetical protein K0U83_05855 [bacterium]|nr:hypothetical protein [bacterium]
MSNAQTQTPRPITATAARALLREWRRAEMARYGHRGCEVQHRDDRTEAWSYWDGRFDAWSSALRTLQPDEWLHVCFYTRRDPDHIDWELSDVVAVRVTACGQIETQ